MLCLVPGLTGTSSDIYILNVIVKAHELNYVCVVINHRGAPGTVLNTPKLYNAASSDDVRQALAYIRKSKSNRDIFAIGFSLGANLLTKYLGEEGENTFLAGAAAVSNPWNFNLCYESLQGQLFGFYDSLMSDLIKQRYMEHQDVFM